MKKTLFSCLLLLLSFSSFSQCITTAVNGAFTIIVRRADGTLYGRGRNDFGQLGDGTTITDYSTMRQIGTDNDWSDIFSSDNHTIAIKVNGTLWAWGRNNEGQIGNGTTINQLIPIQIGTDNDWIAVGTGDYNSIALKSNGTIWTWGKNDYGQLGNGTLESSYVPQQVGTDTDWVKIAAKGLNNYAIKANGTLWQWGINSHAQLGIGTYGSGDIRTTPTQVGIDTDWSVISGGSSNNLAIKTNGTLWSWGSNGNGELGIGTFGGFGVSPIQVGTDTNWSKVSTSSSVSVALKNDGTLWTWGFNMFGQVGDGTITDRNLPVQIGTDHDWVYIDHQNNRTYAMKSNGLLYGFGISTYNEFGNGAILTNPNPVLIQINCNNLDITAIEKSEEVVAYPNPTSDYVTINFKNYQRKTKFLITNVLGQVIKQYEKELPFGENKEMIDFYHYDKGIYFITFNQQNNIENTIKIIKQQV